METVGDNLLAHRWAATFVQIGFNEDIFKTAEAAEDYSMNAAKEWIDERLGR